MSKYILNNSGSEGTWRGQTIADGSYYQLQNTEPVEWSQDVSVIGDLASGDLVASTANDSGGHVSAGVAVLFLSGSGFLDPDTEAPLVSTKKLKENFYFQCREIEWETSKLDSVHDRDLAQTDLGVTSLAFFDANLTELVSPSQATLDAQCRYTRVSFVPGTEWGVRGILLSHRDELQENVYVYGVGKILIHPAPVYLELPQADGGLNMYFVKPYGEVGVDEENFTYFTANDSLDFWIYHPVGFKHRMQGKLKIALPMPGT